MKLVSTLLASLTLAASASYAEVNPPRLTPERLLNAASDADNWLSYGRDYAEQRYSPLDAINTGNVEQLNLAWHFDTETFEGLQATPLVIDGVMYVSGSWSRVYALDAKSGQLLWQYDPKVPRKTSIKMCCGAVNRGVAAWGDRIYVGTLDGRLVALDQQSGAVQWQTQTTDPQKNYSITGAPRVAKGKVFIGNGGAEYGVRGYVSAYDAESGELLWRFYTVPGNPEAGFENEAMANAADTWTGEWWQYGGGGTVWDSIVYDPELDQLYIGVGNGSPHNQRIRSPEGGDNLYLSSIVALNPDTGNYLWHYQQVPGESWDYTATQQMMLLSIEWQGQTRKVIAQAPKAGFFYLLDRHNGELLSAEPYVKVTWASGYDMQTGRPIINDAARYRANEPVMVYPTAMGGHNWQPMSYSPKTGFIYLPILEMGAFYNGQSLDEFVFKERHWNVGYHIEGSPLSTGLTNALLKTYPKSYLLAWDLSTQQEVWRQPHSYLHAGGTLATAGDLVFQGSADHYLRAYAADDGRELWAKELFTGISAAPISYRVDDEQYIAVAAGRGGALSMAMGIEHDKPAGSAKIYSFKLNGQGQWPEPPAPKAIPSPPPRMTDVSEEQRAEGQRLFNSYCGRCHGMNVVGDGSVPELRRLDPIWHQHFNKVVLEGMMESAGMPRFDDVLDTQSARWVQAYIIERAHQDAERRSRPLWQQRLLGWYEQLAATVMSAFM